MPVDLLQQQNLQSSESGVDLFHALGIKPPTPQEVQNNSTSNMLNKISSSALNFAAGTADAFDNLFIDTANLVPGINIPRRNSGSGTAYDVGNVIGNIGGFFGGGEAAEALRAGVETIPYVGKGAEYLGREGLGAIKRALGAAGYGAIETPENRGKGALEGVVSSGLTEIPGVALRAVSPKKYMNAMYEKISESLGKAKEQSRELYGSLMRDAGDIPVRVNDDSLKKEVFFNKKNLKQLFNEFEKDPTVNNAHRLQSQLGSEARSLKTIDVATHDRKNAYEEAREALLSGITQALGGSGSEYAQKYADAMQHYRNTVVPYDMTHEAINHITQPTPEKIVRELEKITKHESYPNFKIGENRVPLVPEDIMTLHKGLNRRIAGRNIAQMGTGALTGGIGGAHLAVPFATEAGALLGGAAPSFLNKHLGQESPYRIFSQYTKTPKKSHVKKLVKDLAPNLGRSSILAPLLHYTPNEGT